MKWININEQEPATRTPVIVWGKLRGGDHAREWNWFRAEMWPDGTFYATSPDRFGLETLYDVVAWMVAPRRPVGVKP